MPQSATSVPGYPEISPCVRPKNTVVGLMRFSWGIMMKIPARASCASRGGHGDQAENSAGLQQRCWIGDCDASTRPDIRSGARAARVRHRLRRPFTSPGSAQKGAAEAPTSTAPQRTPDPYRVLVRVIASNPTRLARACLAPPSQSSGCSRRPGPRAQHESVCLIRHGNCQE